jgi:hypothetical protein
VTAPEQRPPGEPEVEEPDDPDDDLFDDGWQAPKRTSRLTVALLVALLVVGGFAGGVLAQKHHDVGLAAAAAGPAADGGDTAGAQEPLVVGTVRTADADAIEVTDAGGAIVRVFVPKTATVTTLGLGALTYGTPVAVAGTKAVDGSVTATSVTVRQAGG